MFLPFFPLCSVPCTGIRRSAGAGTGIAIGGGGHLETEKTVACED